MNKVRLYYTPPSDELFSEVKQRSIEIWETYDDEFGYATKKIASIKDIGNISDNFMYMVAMFDFRNQMKLASLLGEAARTAIRERMIDGGQPIQYICF